jgi:type I restriction enzyme S subunit
MQRLAMFLARKYPGTEQREAFRAEVMRVCSEFVSSGMADDKFEIEITSDMDGKFWSCLSEALIFEQIKHKIFPSRDRFGIGPDFLITAGSRRIWIEVVCPTPSGVPKDWIEIQFGQGGSVPHNEILLRWTSAFKEKAQKLLGVPDSQTSGYLAKGIVSTDDSYVIAINGCQLRHGPFAALTGVSQFPYAAEAVFPIGPYQIRIDRETLQAVGSGYQERFSISKANAATVPTHAFLDPAYKMISAIWAVDFNGCGAIGNRQPSAVIHNPCAANPIPVGFLPANEEFQALQSGEDNWTFGRVGPNEI